MLRSRSYSRTEPSTEPVTAQELAEHLRVDYHDHDAYLETLIQTARKEAEESHLWQCLIDQTCIDLFDEFEDGMELHWSPVDSITSIGYTDANGDSQTLGTSVYELGKSHGVGHVRLKYNQTFPTTRSHEDVVTVTYKAGYGTAASDIPVPILHAIKMYAAWLYRNPTGGGDAPTWFKNLLAPYSSHRIVNGE